MWFILTVLSTMDNAVPSVLAALLSWATMYILLCIICSTRSYEWHVRLVTMAHATLVTVLSWICSYNYGPWPFTDAGECRHCFQIKMTGWCYGLEGCCWWKCTVEGRNQEVRIRVIIVFCSKAFRMMLKTFVLICSILG